MILNDFQSLGAEQQKALSPMVLKRGKRKSQMEGGWGAEWARGEHQCEGQWTGLEGRKVVADFESQQQEVNSVFDRKPELLKNRFYVLQWEVQFNTRLPVDLRCI